MILLPPTLCPSSPSLPPSSLPPSFPPPLTSSLSGPPEVHYYEQGVSSAVVNKEDSKLSQVVATGGYENGEIEESESEEEEEEEPEQPPPIPPRSNSLSPETKNESLVGTTGRGLVEGLENGSADHFLGEGRGGGASLPPLFNKSGTGPNTAASANEEDEEAPPPIPKKVRERRAPPPKPARDIEAEEGELLSELNRLLPEEERTEIARERQVAQQETRLAATSVVNCLLHFDL